MEGKHRVNSVAWVASLLLAFSLTFVLSACNSTNENSTAASLTVVANQQAGGIKQLPSPPAADTPIPAQTTQAAAGGGGGATTQAAAGGNSADIQAGLQLFQSTGCSGCHSNNGKAAGVGPKLQGDPKITGSDYVVNQVRNMAVAPMPKYPASQLSDADLNKIAAYIVSLK